MLAKGLRPLQGTQPEQPTEPASIQNQMHGLLQLLHQAGHPLQGQQVRNTALGMTTMAEAVELSELSGPKPSGAPA